ncbi:ankyrin repeat domain-containing protein [Iamia majanohamensis]|uniref:Ankyrin repeat domain-containing protein n=1 Tax=Iamia majanohamensis TaxID=467976 RepID=A0AAE9YAH6_9ACTN|nr:ankyrin repeat domain-containing protein [Iamia majanohamensis]WCO67409.1 ankyrin repeat domain-containing protein [Iamia majanohamensis]
MADGEPADEAGLEDLAGRVFDMARRGDTATLDAYVEAGVPADLANDSGDTLVMLAAYHGHAATVRALLARGAQPDRANDKGQTPLAGAVFKGEADVVAALVDGGADPAAGQPTPVATARMFGRGDLLALLGVDPADGGGAEGSPGPPDGAG